MRDVGIALQPIYDLRRNQTSHWEALARTFHNGRSGAPKELLEAGERSGAIADIDLHVLELSLGVIRRTGLKLAANISPTSVHLAAERYLNVVSQHRDFVSMLVVEVTETAPVRCIASLCRFTDALKGMGCRIALDDYGNGQGFITDEIVSAVKPDLLKLDGSVLDEGLRSRDAMARALMLGAETGAEIVAEFVDSSEKVEFLGALGIRYAQGMYFGLARPWSEIADEMKVA